MPFERVRELWFDDGSIVIRAEDKGFRVFRSTLATRSSVFGDMLAFPPPKCPDQEVIEDCPVVHLQDKAIELEAFLRAIFDPESFLPPPVEIPIETLIGVLRLSHKYNIPYLRKRALLHLSNEIPTTLKNFVKIVRDKLENGMGDLLCESIAVFHEVNAPWLLPFCYVVAVDGYDLNTVFTKSGPFGSFSDGEVILVAKAREEMNRRSARTTEFLISSNLRSTCQASSCARRRQELASTDILDHSPLRFLHFEYDLKRCCYTCQEYFQQLVKEAARDNWKDLPGLFGIPTWADLVEKRQESLSPKTSEIEGA